MKPCMTTGCAIRCNAIRRPRKVKTPSPARVRLIGSEHDQAICSTGYMVLRPKECVDSRFVYYFLQGGEFSDAMASLQKGASE